MRQHIIYSTIILCTLFAACTSDENIGMFDSGNIIEFGLSQREHTTQTRGHLYDKDSALYKEQYGGGNFWVKGYPDNTSTQYINSRVWYFADGERWYFRNSNEWYDSYWPKNNKLSFFAYMPWIADSAAMAIDGYSYNDGPQFSCNLPLDNHTATMNQAKLQEFVYAYTRDKKDETVPLNFVHPMSAIYFKLKQSHRDLIIHSIGFEKMYSQGTYRYEEETTAENYEEYFKPGFTYDLWMPKGARNTMSIRVEKKIPEHLNFNAEIGGPFIVMPQKFQGTNPADTLTMYVTYTWDEDVKVTKGVALKKVHNAADTGWQPGKKYTYNIDLGDNKEEILFKVMVEPWKAEDFKNIVNVE